MFFIFLFWLVFDEKLKGSWIQADNPYERAFKHINKMIKAGKLNFPMLKELIGHEISEVVVGAIIGVLTAVIVYLIF